MVCELIGSFARAAELVDEGSDLDVLVERKGALTEGDIWDIAWTHPPRVFEHIANTVAAVQGAVTGVRQLFEPSDAPPGPAAERDA